MIKNNQSGATMLPFIVAIVGGIAIAWVISVLVSIDDTELEPRLAQNENQMDTANQDRGSPATIDPVVPSGPPRVVAQSARQSSTFNGTPDLAEQLQAVRLQLERLELSPTAGRATPSTADNGRVAQLEVQLRQAEVKIDELSNRIRITDSNGSGSMSDLLDSTIQKAAAEDQNYIRALKGDVETYITTDSQRAALSNVGTDKVDYLNRILLSRTVNNADKEGTDSLERTVIALMTDVEANKKQQKLDQHQSYLTALDPLSQQRANQSRTYTVQEGDNLWDIAVRAYGNGFLYTKIFHSNPQILINPDLIFPGQVIRVPI